MGDRASDRIDDHASQIPADAIATGDFAANDELLGFAHASDLSSRTSWVGTDIVREEHRSTVPRNDDGDAGKRGRIIGSYRQPLNHTFAGAWFG